MKKQLADGLILRTLSEGYASDRDRLPDFYAGINTAGESEYVQDGLRHWTRDLMSGHPTTTLDDVFVVVDPAKDDMLVSATLLIPQTWRYEDIDIAVGRPELVATHPEYRSRGLVRTLFDAVHERSATLGHQMQAITGILFFYRKFGYTMAVDLGEHAIFQLSALPDLAPEYTPAFTLRHATPDDIPAIAEWSAYLASERLLSDHFSPAALHYEITGRHPGYYPHTEYQVIVDATGQGVGYLTLLTSLDEPYRIRCVAYAVGNQTSYLATFGDVMQGVKAWALATYGRCPAMLAFGSGVHETLDRLIDHSPGGVIRQRQAWAWYLRVPDTISFLKHIAPVLERRLHGSGAHRWTGELRIGFHDLTGIALQFENGRLIDTTLISGKDGYDIQFPWHMFWNVIFGHATAGEIFAVVPDVWAKPKAAVLLDILFPKKASWLTGLA
jgi:GNAT superfamily N-acetyltransferase